MPGARVCASEGCFEPLPHDAGPRRKYHDDRCQKREEDRRRRARQRAERGEDPQPRGKRTANAKRKGRDESKDGRGSPRWGPGYEKFRADGWPEEIAAGHRGVREVAAELGVGHGTVSRWMAAWAVDVDKARQRESAERSPDAAATLEDFAAFRARYFRTPNVEGAELAGVPYLTPGFHERWVDAIESTIATGGRQIILSPPRHGKSDLLTHVCIWLIMRNPNIRIMWVGINDEVATQSVELVKDELETNELLKHDFADTESGEFRPPQRSGKAWSAHRFTVATRTISQKSPTMVAIGRGGKLVSRDADLIVADDIIDHTTVQSPSQRESDARWFRTQLSSRKMKHTGLFVIGSRQHPVDLYSGLLENPIYRQIVEQAHDPECALPEDEPERHVECVLFPELNPYDYLMEQRADLDSGGVEMFEMVYQNNPAPEGVTIFDKETVDACKNAARSIGDLDWELRPGRPLRGLRLIAGLDPASAGFQASFLWAVDLGSGAQFCVDIDNTKAGGLPAAERIIREWHLRYDCRHWLIEENNYQGAIRQSREITDYCAANGIRLEPIFTTKWNKHDEVYGVTSMAQVMRSEAPADVRANRLIDLPYADADSRRQVDAYARQLLQFTGDPQAKKRSRSDIVMASWFPQQTIRGLQRKASPAIEFEYAPTAYPGASSMSKPFWRS